MTEEQLRIARNTWDELVHQRSQVSSLEKIISGDRWGITISKQGTLNTGVAEDEMYFLEELLKYRKQALTSLEKEFANL